MGFSTGFGLYAYDEEYVLALPDNLGEENLRTRRTGILPAINLTFDQELRFSRYFILAEAGFKNGAAFSLGFGIRLP